MLIDKAGPETQSGYNGDDIPATEAWLNFPSGIAVDAMGNVYIGDSGRIRKVNISGTIATIAGDGSFGFSGDGGLATSAILGFVEDVAVDSRGNLYVAESFDDFRIRVVDTSGTIQTIAGTGLSGYNGDGLSATETNVYPIGLAVNRHGELYLSDAGSYRVRKIH